LISEDKKKNNYEINHLKQFMALYKNVQYKSILDKLSNHKCYLSIDNLFHKIFNA